MSELQLASIELSKQTGLDSGPLQTTLDHLALSSGTPPTSFMNQSPAPQVDVVMACYNAMPYLPDAVQSVLHQTYSNFSLIVVDDGSTDASPGYLHEVACADPRVKLARQANQGQQAAANHGIRLGQAKYIVRMDADDVASLDRLRLQVEFMDSHPDIGLSGGQLTRMGSQKHGLKSNLPLGHDEIVAGLLKNHHTMCNGTTIMRRELFEQVGGYWEHNISEDWDLFLRIAEISRLANQDFSFLAYRLHTGSVNGRRIVESQLHNEFAAERYRRRQAKLAEISFEEFFEQHRGSRWPWSWQFYLDAQSIGQYRQAVAEIYSGKPLSGYSRLGLSMLMSPTRTLRRVGNMLTR